MIEDKARVRAVADQVRDLAQLVVRRAQIEDELPPSDLPDPLHECVPSAETCRLPLDVLADAFDAMAGGERGELTIDRLRVGEVGERHDAGETRLPLCEAFHECDLARLFRVPRSAFPVSFVPRSTFRVHDTAHPARNRSRATASTMMAPMMIS